MWWKGLNRVKTRSKWAHFTCLCTPNGPRATLHKCAFDPFGTHFWSQNGAFSRHFGVFHGRKRVILGSKWPKKTCLGNPNGPRSLLEKCVFDQFLTHFWFYNGPFSRHFGILHGPKRVTTGSKWAINTCLSIPNGPGLLLEKCVFDPFLTHFWSQTCPFSRHFGIFLGPKRATTGLKWPKNACLSIPHGLGTTLEKIFFFLPRGPRWTHGWPQPCAGCAALRLHEATTGTRCARLVGRFPGLETTKSGGLRVE